MVCCFITIGTQLWLASTWSLSEWNHVHILEMMIHNSILLYEANGEGELKSMENQVSTVLMKVMFPIFPLWTRPAVCCVSKRDKAVLDD